MDKVNIEICMGTTCFVMGASGFQEITNQIPHKYKDQVDICFKTCLGFCQNNEYNKSPYVVVNGEVISEATLEKIINCIESNKNG